jgi:hypothetical protein
MVFTAMRLVGYSDQAPTVPRATADRHAIASQVILLRGPAHKVRNFGRAKNCYDFPQVFQRRNSLFKS